jgi:2OG-Fe dioxygenase
MASRSSHDAARGCTDRLRLASLGAQAAAVTQTVLVPPYVSPAHLVEGFAQQGHAVLSPQGVAELAQCSAQELAALGAGWHDLPPDEYLKDGGRYRRRRHSCFVVGDGLVTQAPHRAHWQPLAYNALHGGMQRWFEPIRPDIVALPAWTQLLRWLADVADRTWGVRPWHVEAHQFASTPPTALVARHRKARTATASTWWRCSWSSATTSRVARHGCSMPRARTAGASRWPNPGRCCCSTTHA